MVSNNNSNRGIRCIELGDYLASLLQVEKIADYCPNGLQVEGRPIIKKLITGVTACQRLLDAAIKEHADAIIVHHGYFWKNENPCVIGIKQRRIATLLRNDVNLLAYHLPLDVHPTLGNNAELAKLLQLPISDSMPLGNIPAAILVGEFPEPIAGQELADRINIRLQRAPFYHAGSKPLIKRIAWCTGAAQDYLEDIALAGCDAYITGEVSERTIHIAREYDVHFFAAGHHATERYGVKALGEHLAEKFGLQHQFIDIDNPI